MGGGGWEQDLTVPAAVPCPQLLAGAAGCTFDNVYVGTSEREAAALRTAFWAPRRDAADAVAGAARREAAVELMLGRGIPGYVLRLFDDGMPLARWEPQLRPMLRLTRVVPEIVYVLLGAPVLLAAVVNLRAHAPQHQVWASRRMRSVRGLAAVLVPPVMRWMRPYLQRARQFWMKRGRGSGEAWVGAGWYLLDGRRPRMHMLYAYEGMDESKPCVARQSKPGIRGLGRVQPGFVRTHLFCDIFEPIHTRSAHASHS
eukprot:366122-Chlamydomonas_euryale.AAC.4